MMWHSVMHFLGGCWVFRIGWPHPPGGFPRGRTKGFSLVARTVEIATNTRKTGSFIYIYVFSTAQLVVVFFHPAIRLFPEEAPSDL